MCEQFEENGTIARYVAGIAPAHEGMAFENHYIECADCLHAVSLGAAVRDQLKRKRAPHKRRLAWIGLAAAAALTGVVAVGGIRTMRLQALGALDAAPAYEGIPVRATESNVEAQFDAAMEAYRDGRYREAANGLEAAIRAGIDPVPAEFFLGTSLLELGQAAAAASSYRRVIAQGESPYLQEAHYYLAKSLLRLSRSRDALEHLREAAKAEGVLGGNARALIESIQKVTGKSF